MDDPDNEAGEQRTYAAAGAAAARARLLIALGGDNSITYPVALGVVGSSLATGGLITLDAHHDLRDGVSNGSPVRRLLEAGFDGARVVQVGISDFANSRFYADRARAAGITVIEYLTNLHRIGSARCRFLALPLALDQADGSPVRAVALID